MHYFSLSELPSVSSYILPIRSSELESFKEVLTSIPSWNMLSISEKESFLLNMQDEKIVLHYSWVKQLPELDKLLVSGELKENFSDKVGIMQNAFFTEFKQFITPFLYPILVKHFEEKKINHLLSYAVLLSDFQQDEVQNFAKSVLDNKLNPVKQKISVAKKDTDIHVLLEKEIDATTWQLINSFNNRFYAVKTAWVEYLIQLAHHPKSSKRLLLYCVHKMSSIELKEAHTIQVNKLERDIISGVYQFDKNVMPWGRTIAISATVLLILAFCVGIFFYEPTAEFQPKQQETSFMHLSQKERDKISTLLQKEKEMRKMNQEELRIDSNIPFIGEELVLRKNWTNERFEKLYSAWSQTDSVIYSTTFGSSKRYLRPYNGTSNLRKKTSGVATYFRNETTQSVLVIVFKDERKEQVYSTYISSKENAKIVLSEDEILLVLPGSSINENAKANELPFNEIDHKFFDNLSLSFQVKQNPPKEIKLIWENLGGNEFYLVDIYSALIKM